MLLMMGIAFFSSRILLRELGVNDFGLYGVVGGVVAMFGSLRGIFASSIQRFLNFEMGRGNTAQLNKIFSMGVILHLILSVIFLLLAETIGLWFLNNKLVIQPDRYVAANWVYQFSVLASIATIMTVPYDAVLIANERMKAFAYISILDAFLKLGIIFIISYLGNDKLILYGFLILVVSLITRSVSMAYCKKNFEESKLKFTRDKKLFKQIGTFAGWNFLGNTSFTLSNEGVNMVLNIFGGTAINAARTIAYQVKSVTMQFVSNILMAVNPHLIKLYSQDKNKEFTDLLFFTSKLSFFVLFILCVPIYLFAETILILWLVNVPNYTIVFVQLILIYLLVRAFHNPIDTLFKASGKIKYYQIIESITLFLNLPISYILLKNNFEVHSVFVVMILIEVVNLALILSLAQGMNQLNIIEYLINVILPCSIVTIIATPISFFLFKSTIDVTIYIQFLYLIIVVLICGLSIYLLGFNKKEKAMLYKTLISRRKLIN
jgi:O-antigen/teichoic acid export membrane protein